MVYPPKTFNIIIATPAQLIKIKEITTPTLLYRLCLLNHSLKLISPPLFPSPDIRDTILLPTP